ncbi:winged helix-turn-helix domain-containing protein [Serratia plymuthica]|uniref:winged helix-turn-helix domain-containing protein n=1 Tax=Serratia plymuthica TaxID=82996 RepID=UPI0020169481|nr:winged helix-turn-helix domain-containing protein [Serratia plymuthica]
MLARIDDANNKIALLKPASRLLSLFIRNNNKLLLRERLLNEVWVEHGLKASNNNLNNYVSGLRKSLAQCGAEEIIITYPRQGFKFSAKNIHEVNVNQEISSDGERCEPEIIFTPPPQKSDTSMWHAIQRLIMIAATCLVPFAAIVLYQNSTRINVYPLGNYQHCKIYSMTLGSGNIEKVKRMIKQAGLSCQQRADVYYYNNILNESSQRYEEQITFCPRDTRNPCINNYKDHNES